jgi:NAD(P)-dependent dehydrogenase (short-subunit alcohol dehydrogenase family)
MKLGLAGKSAVVTGVRQGIGLAVTQALVGPDLASVQSVGAVTFDSVDLSASSGPQTFVDRAVALGGRVDIVANNVGAVTPRRSAGRRDDLRHQWLLSLQLGR